MYRVLILCMCERLTKIYWQYASSLLPTQPSRVTVICDSCRVAALGGCKSCRALWWYWLWWCLGEEDGGEVCVCA